MERGAPRTARQLDRTCLRRRPTRWGGTTPSCSVHRKSAAHPIGEPASRDGRRCQGRRARGLRRHGAWSSLSLHLRVLAACRALPAARPARCVHPPALPNSRAARAHLQPRQHPGLRTRPAGAPRRRSTPTSARRPTRPPCSPRAARRRPQYPRSGTCLCQRAARPARQ